MYIPIPFCNHTRLDTQRSASLTDGPTAEEMRSMVEEVTRYDSYLGVAKGTIFASPGLTWIIDELLGIREHPTLIDTWWLWATLEDKGNPEAYILWSPNNLRTSYLCGYNDTIDTFGWGWE